MSHDAWETLDRERAALRRRDFFFQGRTWGALLIILIIGAVSAITWYIAGGDQQRPGHLPVDHIVQSGSATDGGIIVHAVGASFDEQDSYVVVRLVIENTGAIEAAAGGDFDREHLTPAGFEGPLATGEPQVTTEQGGHVLLRFPPFEPGPSYDGTIPLRITVIEVAARDGVVRIEGEWPLLLRGPERTELTPADEG